MKTKPVILATAFIAASSLAYAQETGDISVGVGVTNLGLALQGEYAINPQTSARAMIMGGFNIDDEFEADDGTVDGEASFGGFAVVADYYPLSNPWRISGGLFISNIDISGTVESGGEIFEASLELENSVAPMITTGFKADVAEGWAISGDLGVIISSFEASSDDTLDADEQAELDDINSALGDIPVFPFIGFAVSYSY